MKGLKVARQECEATSETGWLTNYCGNGLFEKIKIMMKTMQFKRS
jgi:hypothetical protein